MSANEIILILLTMLAGLGIFMFGLKTMSERLEMQAGSKLRKMFGKATNNKFSGLAVGAGVTAIIQSSSATTVMVVGFVNANVLTLTQATLIIMGANIGTTVTAVIISLPIAEVLAASGVIGIFMVMLSKNKKTINIGYTIVGLAMIFAGLEVMGGAMKQFAEVPSIQNFFSSTTNPFMLIILGMLVTALVQSSSATTGILISIGLSGLIGIESAIFIILGINIGTCITAILAAIGTNYNAQRAAAVHLMFNLTGTIIFGLILAINPIRELIITSLSSFNFLPDDGIAAQIAAFHIIFNIATTLILLPFVGILVRTAEKIIKERAIDSNSPYSLKYVNDLMLETPPLAVAQIKDEIVRMLNKSKMNFDLAVEGVANSNTEHYEEFAEREKYIDWLNINIPQFLTNIASLPISYNDEKKLASYYHVVSDIERVGDYAENLYEYAEKMETDNLEFSEEAKSEILEMYSEINKMYTLVLSGFKEKNTSYKEQIELIEDKIDAYNDILSKKHICRLNDGTCTAQTGALFLSLISNLERIADHFRNIYNSIFKHTKSTSNIESSVINVKEHKYK